MRIFYKTEPELINFNHTQIRSEKELIFILDATLLSIWLKFAQANRRHTDSINVLRGKSSSKQC